MNWKTVVICFLFLTMAVLLIGLDNQHYEVEAYDFDEHGNEIFQTDLIGQSLFDQMGSIENSLLILGAFFWPFLLIIESTFFPKLTHTIWRLVFLLQGIALAWLSLMVWFIMVFKLFTTIHVTVVYFVILVYFGSGIVLNLLLSIPGMDRLAFVVRIFEFLSLKKKTDV